MTDYLYLDISYHCNLYMMQEHRGFDGVARREFTHVIGSKGFWGNEEENFKVRHGLIIPCDRSVTATIRQFLDNQSLMRGASDSEEALARGPYYFTGDMQHDPAFENMRTTPTLFGGPYTAYADRFAPERPSAPRHWLLAAIFGPRATGNTPSSENREALPLARHNCWTAPQGITQYIGGIDLGALLPSLATSFRAVYAIEALQKLYDTAKKGNDPTLHFQKISNSAAFIRRDGLPPVIHVSSAEPKKFTDFMDNTRSGNGESLTEIMAREKSFPSTPLAQHTHMKAPAP